MRAMTVLGALTVPGSERSVAHARRFVRDMVGSELPACADAVLCVSELVTNAVRHTASKDGGRVTVTVVREVGALRVEVSDDGACGRTPHVREELLAEDGRGLLIVTALAAGWGAETRPAGTTTWFRLDG